MAPGPSPEPQATPEAIGVDLGGTKMRVGVVDSQARVLSRTERPTPTADTPTLLDALADELAAALAAHPEAPAAGLGVPCRMHRESGVAIGAVNLPISDVPIRDLLAERLGRPVFVDNDANVAAIAEHRHGAARGARYALMLTVGTGVGGGVIVDDRVYRGATGAGAELGHIVVDVDGPPCQGSCPNRGCLEAIASGNALGREGIAAAERDPDSRLGRVRAEGREITGRLVTELALAGDGPSRELVGLIAHRLGAGVSGLANAFEPEVIVIGGGVLAAGELLLEPIREAVRTRALPPMDRIPVVAAQLGSDAGMIGAATMAMLELEGGS